MARINLLPWREELREKRKKEYINNLIVVFVISILSVYLVIQTIDAITTEQKNRNAFLQQKIQKLDKKIADIRNINKRRKDIERRSEIILRLQSDGNLPTYILDELARVVPTGMYLESVNKQGSMLWLKGRSESNNNVANMMRRVENSSWLQEPSVESIVTQKASNKQLQSFNLNIAINHSGLAAQAFASTEGK